MPSGVIYVGTQRKGGESGAGGGGEKQCYKSISMYICTPPYPSVIFKHFT